MRERKASEKEPRRRKGQGSLYKQGRIYIARWMVAGRVYKRSTGESELRAAQQRLASFVAPFAARTDAERLEALAARAAGARAEAERAEKEQPKLAVRDLWRAFDRSPARRQTATSTSTHYKAALDDLARFAEERGIVEARDIGEKAAAEYCERASSLSPNAYNKRLALFSRVWRILATQICAGANPWHSLARRPLDAHSRRPLGSEELDSVLRAAAAMSEEHGLLFKLGAFTGLRLGDCCLLDWCDVDMEGSSIKVRPRKTARSTGALVAIPLVPELRAALEEIPSEKRTGRVLPNLARRYLSDPPGIARDNSRIFAAAGIQTSHAVDGQRNRAVDVGFHSLRHTFVTRCALAGVPLPVVRAIVGHSTTAMTEHYAHSNLEAAREALARAFPAK